MGKKVNVSVLFFVAALCFFVSTIIGYIEDGQVDTFYISLGSLNLVIGCAYLAIAKKNAEKENEEDK